MRRSAKKALHSAATQVSVDNRAYDMALALVAVLDLHRQVTYPDPVRYGRTAATCEYCSSLNPEMEGQWPCPTVAPLEHIVA